MMEDAAVRPSALVRDRAVERLTALWALNEAGMGGLIHAMKIPFTGIVVGSVAVILISAIGFFAERRAAAILRATMVVMLIKAAVSPHTPAPAYVAVLFQGAVGAMLFGCLPWPRIAGMLLGLLALWQGALQKLLVMTLIYGRPLWDSVDAVGRRILELMGQAPEAMSPTFWFLVLYMGYYTLGGFITGWLAATLPGEIARAVDDVQVEPVPAAVESEWHSSTKPWWRRPPFRAGVVAAILCLVLMVLSPAGTGLERGLRLLVRAGVAIGIWILLVGPLAKRVLRWFQRREQSRYAADVARAMELLPSLRASAAAAWARANGVRGLRRWKRFFVDLVARALVQ